MKAERRADGTRSREANEMKEKKRAKMIEAVSDFAASSSFPGTLCTRVIRFLLIELHALKRHC